MRPGQFDNPDFQDKNNQPSKNSTTNLRRPGSALSERQLWQPRIENGKETGVRDPEGNFIPLNEGESFVINKGEGTDFEAVAVGQNGERRILKPFKAEAHAQRRNEDAAEIARLRQQLGAAEIATDRDSQYSEKYWQLLADKGSPPEEIAKKREGYRENILDAVSSGRNIVQFFVEGENFAEDEKAKASMYRVLAKEMGYKIGPYKINKKSGTATAEIKKL